MAYERMQIFSGTGNPAFAEAVAKNLGVRLTPVSCGAFANEETKIKLEESVRGADVYIIQSTVPPKVNDHYFELWLLARTAKESDARRVTAILPYCGYTKQDKKKDGREPVSMRLMADICNVSGIDRYVFIDLHNPAIEGFFSPKNSSNISSKYILCEELSKRADISNYVILAPDEGAVKRARKIAVALNVPVAMIDKERDTSLGVKVMAIIGDVRGKNVCIPDDLIDTGSTIKPAVQAAKNAGALDVIVACTHATLTAPAAERINQADIKELIVTDTVPVPQEKRAAISKPICTLSFVPIITDFMDILYNDKSVNDYFKKKEGEFTERMKKGS